NRVYNVTVHGGATAYLDTVKFHYLDTELNGNVEANLKAIRDTSTTSGIAKWALTTKLTNDATNNFVADTLHNGNTTSRWVLAENNAAFYYIWVGGATNGNWDKQANWQFKGATPGTSPGINEINDYVIFGSAAFTKSPSLN